MMSETAIEIATCGACGADVRNESLYCYSCGEPVKEESTGEVKESLEQQETIPQSAPRPPLRSAASLRKERRAFNRKPVEVSWEQRTGSSVAFVVTTIVLVTGALVLLLLALYLR